MVLGAVGDEGDRGTPRGEAAGGQLRDVPRPGKEHAAAVELAEDLLRKRGGSGGDGGRILADRRLGAHLLARVQRLAEQPVEDRAGHPGLVGLADLAEDLALTGNHRVEPGRDAEEVQRRRLVGQTVEDTAELVLGQAAHAHQRGERADLRVGPDQVELGAVAGRKADGLAVTREPAGELGRLVQRDECALPHRHGRRLVGKPDERQHHEKWVTWRPRRAMITSAKPARAR
jgi:hypothetical protein